MKPQYRKATKRIRPFAQSAQVRHRGCSRPLQRAVTDFGADLPFAQVMDKLVEHYGIVLGESTIRHIAEGARPADIRGRPARKPELANPDRQQHRGHR